MAFVAVFVGTVLGPVFYGLRQDPDYHYYGQNTKPTRAIEYLLGWVVEKAAQAIVGIALHFFLA